jgi:transposase
MRDRVEARAGLTLVVDRVISSVIAAAEMNRRASVATVARRHDVNPNQVFAWRQMYRRGLLDPKAPPTNPPMLPVKVSTPTVLPTERALVEVPAQTRHSKPLSDAIEIQLANGHGIVVQGRIDTKVLARVIALLVRR